MGEKNIRRNILDKMRVIFGHSKHLWMYDYKSMINELEIAEFKKIKKCIFGDSQIKIFEEVEEQNAVKKESKKTIIPAPKKLISNFVIKTLGKVISQKLVIRAIGSNRLKLRKENPFSICCGIIRIFFRT